MQALERIRVSAGFRGYGGDYPYLIRHANRCYAGPGIFLCVLCWHHCCACHGAADEVDTAIGNTSGLVDPSTTDTGVCDTCWTAMGGRALRVQQVPEVHFDA